MEDGSSASAKDTSSVPSLQTPGASALSSLASTGSSILNRLNTAKSAPSGLDQIPQTAPTPQPPSLLTRAVTQVQSSSSQSSSLFQSASFSSLSSASLKHPQSSGPGLFGQSGNDKGMNGKFSSSFQGTSSSSLSSGSFKIPQSSGSGLFGQAGNDKDTSSSVNLRPQQSSGFGFGSQAVNDKGTSSQLMSSFQSTSPASLLSGSLRPQQLSGSGFGSQSGNDKGIRAPTSTQKLSPMERGSQTGPQKLTASGARTLAMPSARQSGVSEPEQAFIVELEKVSNHLATSYSFVGYSGPLNALLCITMHGKVVGRISRLAKYPE